MLRCVSACYIACIVLFILVLTLIVGANLGYHEVSLYITFESFLLIKGSESNELFHHSRC